MAAKDGQSLAGQDPGVQAAFNTAFGSNAGSQWESQHNQQIGGGGQPPPPPPVDQGLLNQNAQQNASMSWASLLGFYDPNAPSNLNPNQQTLAAMEALGFLNMPGVNNQQTTTEQGLTGLTPGGQPILSAAEAAGYIPGANGAQTPTLQALSQAAQFLGTYNNSPTLANLAQQAGFLGTYNGQQTQQAQLQAANIAAQQAGLTGQINGQDTLARQAQNANLTGMIPNGVDGAGNPTFASQQATGFVNGQATTQEQGVQQNLINSILQANTGPANPFTYLSKLNGVQNSGAMAGMLRGGIQNATGQSIGQLAAQPNVTNIQNAASMAGPNGTPNTGALSDYVNSLTGQPGSSGSGLIPYHPIFTAGAPGGAATNSFMSSLTGGSAGAGSFGRTVQHGGPVMAGGNGDNPYMPTNPGTQLTDAQGNVTGYDQGGGNVAGMPGGAGSGAASTDAGANGASGGPRMNPLHGIISQLIGHLGNSAPVYAPNGAAATGGSTSNTPSVPTGWGSSQQAYNKLQSPSLQGAVTDYVANNGGEQPADFTASMKAAAPEFNGSGNASIGTTGNF